MTFPMELSIIFGLCVLFGSVGLYRAEYFASLGYGLSVAASGGMLLLLFHDRTDISPGLVCGMLIIYGCIIAAGTLSRVLDAGKGRGGRRRYPGADATDMGVKIMLWISCGALLALMLSPLCYRMAGGGKGAVSVIIGIVVMAAGAILQWIGASGRRRRRRRPSEEEPRGNRSSGVNEGRRRAVTEGGRQSSGVSGGWPGMVILWAGVFIAGVTSFVSPGQWILSITGFLGLVLFVWKWRKI